jgi:dihydropteroate synthase
MLRGRVLAPDRAAVMAVVNRTPDSFHVHHDDDAAAQAAVARAVADGADLVDIGGVRAGRGPVVDAVAEIDRVRPLVTWVRATYPDLPISVDTWRAEVAEAVLSAGADLVNDTWAGHDPELVGIAAAHGAGIVCSHTGGLPPRTDPLRPQYPAAPDAADPRDGVLGDVLATVSAAARRAVAAGVDPRSVLVDPTHDFGKTTWHSLHLSRRTPELVALGFPVLMALSRKDFVGESLDLPVGERLEGTLATTAVAAWLGATVFRAHDVLATRRVVEMVAVLRGDAPPARAVRGLA